MGQHIYIHMPARNFSQFCTFNLQKKRVFSRTSTVKKNRVGAWISNVENFCSYSEVNLLHAVHLSYEIFSTPLLLPLKLKCVKGEVLLQHSMKTFWPWMGGQVVLGATLWLPYPREYPRYPYDRRQGGPQAGLNGFGWRGNPLPPLVIEPRTVKPVASQCTDYAVSAPN